VTIAAAMSRRFWLFALILVSACSGGGGGGSSLNEILHWPAFRRDPFNSGLGGSSIDDNDGQIWFEAALQAPEGAETLPVPAIGKKLQIYIGTADGLVALDKDGNEISCFRFCNLEDAAGVCDTPSPTCIEVGPIDSTPSVNGEGDLIVSTARGYVFAIHDESIHRNEQRMAAGAERQRKREMAFPLRFGTVWPFDEHCRPEHVAHATLHGAGRHSLLTRHGRTVLVERTDRCRFGA
jgi:hypothetical protein